MERITQFCKKEASKSKILEYAMKHSRNLSSDVDYITPILEAYYIPTKLQFDLITILLRNGAMISHAAWSKLLDHDITSPNSLDKYETKILRLFFKFGSEFPSDPFYIMALLGLELYSLLGLALSRGGSVPRLDPEYFTQNLPKDVQDTLQNPPKFKRITYHELPQELVETIDKLVT